MKKKFNIFLEVPFIFGLKIHDHYHNILFTYSSTALLNDDNIAYLLTKNLIMMILSFFC